MFRGFLYNTSLYRQGLSSPVAGQGTLNVSDLKNYTVNFTLIADTFADFILNGELIDGSLGIPIQDEGYYEAFIYNVYGVPVLSRFCFFDSATHTVDFEVVSKNDYFVKNNYYLTKEKNRKNAITLYSVFPVVAAVGNNKGVVWDRNFSQGEYDSVVIYENRSLIVIDDSNSVELYNRILTR